MWWCCRGALRAIRLTAITLDASKGDCLGGLLPGRVRPELPTVGSSLRGSSSSGTAASPLSFVGRVSGCSSTGSAGCPSGPCSSSASPGVSSGPARLSPPLFPLKPGQKLRCQGPAPALAFLPRWFLRSAPAPSAGFRSPAPRRRAPARRPSASGPPAGRGDPPQAAVFRLLHLIHPFPLPAAPGRGGKMDTPRKRENGLGLGLPLTIWEQTKKIAAVFTAASVDLILRIHTNL